MRIVVADAVTERVHKWLGDIPAGWTGARLFEVADAWTSNVDKHTVEGQPSVRLCNYVDVYKNDSIVGSLDFMAASATHDQIRKFRIRQGDTLITKDSETADDIGIPAFVEYEADDLICGYHLAMVRPHRRKVVPKFLYWALDSEPIARQWSVTAAGVTRVGIRSTDLNKVTIPLPPPKEQHAIADFLDQETAQIDALVAKQEEFILLLRERRSAVVRVGITQTADLYPVDKLGRTAKVGNGSTPRRDLDAYWRDGDVPWLTSTVVNRPEVDAADQFVTEAAVRECHLPILEPGMLLIGLIGQGPTRGMATISRIRATLSQNLAYIAPDKAKWVSEYLLWTLRASYSEIRQKGAESGAAQGMLNTDDVRRVRLAMPPIPEQQRVVARLDEQTAQIDALIAKAEEHIALAKERRSALITAAVTGQIDVRTARKAS